MTSLTRMTPQGEVKLTADEEAATLREWAEADAKNHAEKYRHARASEYPSLAEQLDALFHAGAFPPEMTARIQAVKDKYPKPDATK